MAVGALMAMGVGWLATTNAPAAALASAIVLALALPWPVFWCSLGWIMLCRPGAELFRIEVGGLAVSEIDALIGLCVLAGLSISLREKATKDVRLPLLALMAWPAWLAVRMLLPDLGAVLPGPPFADLRLVEAYLLAIPLYAVIRRRDVSNVIMLLFGVAAASSVIALLAWVMVQVGALGVGEFSVVRVSSSATGDIRPGGELVIAIVATMVVLGGAWIKRLPRVALIALLLIELYVSKTLSLVLAITSGVLATVATSWRTLRSSSRLALVGLSVLSIALLSGVVGVDNRYNVTERVSETSGSYRLAEAQAITSVLRESPLVLTIGTGVGTQFVFADELIREVKRDTHSVYVSVAAKTGLVGLGLFLLPFVLAAIAALRRGGLVGRSAFGAFVSIAVISVSVPFAWTIPGMTAVLVLFAIAFGAGHDERSLASDVAVR